MNRWIQIIGGYKNKRINEWHNITQTQWEYCQSISFSETPDYRVNMSFSDHGTIVYSVAINKKEYKNLMKELKGSQDAV